MQKEQRREIAIPKEEAAKIRKLLSKKPLGENQKQVYLADFHDGISMNIEIHGSKEDALPYTKAVLFKDGIQVNASLKSIRFFREWSLEHNGTTYTASIKETK